MANRKIKHTQSIFRWILIPMCILILIETGLFAGVITRGQVAQTINSNQAEIVKEKVKNRKIYLETEMISKWSDLNDIIQTVNIKVAEAEKEGAVNLSNIDQSSAECEVLTERIAKNLIETLRAKSVNGIFVVFNNEDLSVSGDIPRGSKPGFYIRDMDPTTKSSEMNSDLLIEKGSVDMVKKLGISTDRTWTPTFEFAEQNLPYYDFLAKPYIQGMKLEQGELLSHAGYWSSPYSLYGNNQKSISYSLPLVTEDGRVYGVLGIEILTDYLKTLLPADEIMDEDHGSYVLALREKNSSKYKTVVSSGNTVSFKENEKLVLKEGEYGYRYKDNFCTAEKMTLYDTNTAFADQEWVLIGMVPQKFINAFSNHIMEMILVAILFTLLFGVFGTLFTSYVISSPIRKLSGSMKNADASGILRLERTGIKEVDSLGESIEGLSRKLKNSASKFTNILELASVKIAGYELNTKTNELFVTDTFFEIFGKWDIDTKSLSTSDFLGELNALEEFRQTVSSKDGALYKVNLRDGIHYIKIKSTENGTKKIGLAEDVTNSIVERKLLEHERDYDLLTGLRNRRSFTRKMNKLFGIGDVVLKKAALIMIDLDNLKQINDTYGHDSGDKYIKCAADAFVKYVPEQTVIARISGDEFYLFFYGYDTEEDIIEKIELLNRSLEKEKLQLPNGEACPVQMSGGYAWYPRSTRDYEELLKYSDFAMYQVKHQTKGSLQEFDADKYRNEMLVSQNRTALTEMIEQMSVKYYFQPIVEAWSGKVFAYEALMRGESQALHYPSDILALAKNEKKLAQIETLTWMKSMETFTHHVESGRIPKGCRIFVNSLPDVHMDEENISVLEKKYADYLEDIVLELTEEEKLSEESLQIKQVKMQEWGGAIALDDFGTGYNGEAVLLKLAPKYVKIDRDIISNLHVDADKRKVVSNILSYAKSKNMYVVAEGVETAGEAEAAVKLGVDYLQGYYIARPDEDPPEPSTEVCYYLQQWNEETS